MGENKVELTRREFTNPKRVLEAIKKAPERYEYPDYKIRPIFGKLDTSNKFYYDQSCEQGFISPVDPWPEHVQNKVKGLDVLTVEGTYPGITTSEDLNYYIPLNAKELVNHNEGKSVYAVLADPSLNYVRQEQLLKGLLAFNASQAFDWDDPEREVFRNRIEGRIRENLPESVIAGVLLAVTAALTKDIRFSGTAIFAARRINQMRSMAHEYFLNNLSGKISPEHFQTVAKITKPLLAKNDDIDLQHAIISRNVSEAMSYLKGTLQMPLKEPIGAVFTLDNAEGDEAMWEDPLEQMTKIKSSIFEILKLTYNQCQKDNVEITSELKSRISHELISLFGAYDIRVIEQNALSLPQKPTIPQVKRVFHPLHTSIAGSQISINPHITKAVQDKMENVFG